MYMRVVCFPNIFYIELTINHGIFSSPISQFVTHFLIPDIDGIIASRDSPITNNKAYSTTSASEHYTPCVFCADFNFPQYCKKIEMNLFVREECSEAESINPYYNNGNNRSNPQRVYQGTFRSRFGLDSNTHDVR